MYTGVSGTAVLRAADAMLRALGGSEIMLLFPASTVSAGPCARPPVFSITTIGPAFPA